MSVPDLPTQINGLFDRLDAISLDFVVEDLLDELHIKVEEYIAKAQNAIGYVAVGN